MISNCFPFSTGKFTDVESVATTTTAVSSVVTAGRPRSSSLSFSEVTEQRDELLEELSQYKSHLVNLTSQMDEFERELCIETALLRAELKAADGETYRSDYIINDLDHALAECRQKLDDCALKLWQLKQKTDNEMAERKKILLGYVSEANRLRLRSRLELIEDDGTMRSLVIQQTELIEIDEKVNEIIEFEILEEETRLRAHKDILAQDRATAVAERRVKRSNALELQMELDRLQCEGGDHLRFLSTEIKNVTESIKQGYKILKELDSGELRPLHLSMPNLTEIDRPSTGTKGGGAANRETAVVAATKAAAFDLRAHVELRGHRLADVAAADNHFRIDGWSCRGFLKKLSGGRSYLHPGRGGHKWLNRWFVFDRRCGTLSYYHRRSDGNNASAVPRESIRFQDIWNVHVDVVESNGKKPRHTFVVTTTKRAFHLSAATEQATRVWADVIFSGAVEGNSMID